MDRTKQPAGEPLLGVWFFWTTGVEVAIVLILSRWVDLIYALVIVLMLAIPIDVAIARARKRRQIRDQD
ncbi:Flp pilus assembly protein TadB [Arthrobacter bambusae]|nr:Flp pilus assembly protein TadB [Arthrobacter bambusae]